VRVHGLSIGYPPRHCSVRGSEAGKRRNHEGDQGVGTTQVQDTYVIMSTTSGVNMLGANYQLTKLLGVRPSVRHLMLYQ